MEWKMEMEEREGRGGGAIACWLGAVSLSGCSVIDSYDRRSYGFVLKCCNVKEVGR